MARAAVGLDRAAQTGYDVDAQPPTLIANRPLPPQHIARNLELRLATAWPESIVPLSAATLSAAQLDADSPTQTYLGRAARWGTGGACLSPPTRFAGQAGATMGRRPLNRRTLCARRQHKVRRIVRCTDNLCGNAASAIERFAAVTNATMLHRAAVNYANSGDAPAIGAQYAPSGPLDLRQDASLTD
ncbi:hypothetical protein [uncultured Jatrophihabitans sp.]|uniref:hypothetical protein n=1 Tax=uncultured Jatrophihabitans sp. TaxID=1610747 RepID=UPI0035CAD282